MEKSLTTDDINMDFAHPVLQVSNKGICCALMTSGITPYDFTTRPPQYWPIVSFEDTEEVRGIISDYNNGKLRLNPTDFVKAANDYDNSFASLTSQIAETISDYAHPNGQLKVCLTDDEPIQLRPAFY